jgi:hypothetical protein
LRARIGAHATAFRDAFRIFLALFQPPFDQGGRKWDRHGG